MNYKKFCVTVSVQQLALITVVYYYSFDMYGTKVGKFASVGSLNLEIMFMRGGKKANRHTKLQFTCASVIDKVLYHEGIRSLLGDDSCPHSSSCPQYRLWRRRTWWSARKILMLIFAER